MPTPPSPSISSTLSNSCGSSLATNWPNRRVPNRSHASLAGTCSSSSCSSWPSIFNLYAMFLISTLLIWFSSFQYHPFELVLKDVVVYVKTKCAGLESQIMLALWFHFCHDFFLTLHICLSGLAVFAGQRDTILPIIYIKIIWLKYWIVWMCFLKLHWQSSIYSHQIDLKHQQEQISWQQLLQISCHSKQICRQINKEATMSANT